MLTQLSLEERPERFDDSSLDVLADPAERRFHIRRLSAWPGLAERHAEVASRRRAPKTPDGVLRELAAELRGRPLWTRL
jgi:hypothetical protein